VTLASFPLGQSRQNTGTVITSGSFPIQHYYVIALGLIQQVYSFSGIFEPPQNSRPRKGDTRQVRYSGSNNIRRHRTAFSRHGDPALGACAPLVFSSDAFNDPRIVNRLLRPSATYRLHSRSVREYEFHFHPLTYPYVNKRR
jgi:hypothetical protein